MTGISTHVLDTSRGIAAAGVTVTLSRADSAAHFSPLATASTDADGRIKSLLPAGSLLTTGTYRLTFDTGGYFHTRNIPTFFPLVEVTFTVSDAARHHHVPLLLSPFGYSTYRGT